MQVREFPLTIATDEQRRAVAELMTPVEDPIGRTNLDIRMSPDQIIIISPGVPVDEPDEE